MLLYGGSRPGSAVIPDALERPAWRFPMSGTEGSRTQAGSGPATGYDPPRVERVLEPGDLDREVQYAGPPATADGLG